MFLSNSLNREYPTIILSGVENPNYLDGAFVKSIEYQPVGKLTNRPHAKFTIARVSQPFHDSDIRHLGEEFECPLSARTKLTRRVKIALSDMREMLNQVALCGDPAKYTPFHSIERP
ncbi:MAG: hypothetical protein AAB353_14560 [Candidatus Hydrogenedentota bacterium]